MQRNRKCNAKLVKTNEVVWDAIRTAMDPEKKLQIAEIEIYR